MAIANSTASNIRIINNKSAMRYNKQTQQLILPILSIFQ